MKKIIKTITSFDGYPLKTCLWLPDNTKVEKLVLFVNSSGPHTYINTFKWTNGSIYHYQEFYAEQFCNRNIAYCSYSTRGVEITEKEPYFEINEKYNEYLPSTSIKDIEVIIENIHGNPMINNIKIYLLGWSEGTIIAPLVALNSKVKVDALLLVGYCNENLKDTLIWQLSGNAEYTIWSYFFDNDKKGYIDKVDFEKPDKSEIKKALFSDFSFEDIDKNNDGKIDIKDTAVRSLPHLENILKAIENNDDYWLRKNHWVPLTTGWFKEHFLLQPTKEILPKLDLPIYIFQGELDTMCPEFYAKNIKETFDKIGKTNLHINIFKEHDHGLNYELFLINNEISEGNKCIFDSVEFM